MRPSLSSGLVFLLVAGSHIAEAQRKSLGFGPSLPHAKFVTNVPPVSSWNKRGPRDVFETAREHIRSIFSLHDGGASVEGRDYFIREDSYTDASTGVSRIFARQIINGLPVADADINMNILDGQVISYSDSVRIFCNCIHPNLVAVR